MDSEKVSSLWAPVYWLTVLADQGSFTAAARHLGVSKAAMSQRIAELEQTAGVLLVQRTTRSVRLTEAGHQLVEATREAFERIADSFEGVRELAATPQGILRLSAPVAFARQQLVPRLPDFLRAYPNVRIELDLSDHLSSLAVEGFDLAIRHASSLPGSYVAWALCATRSVLVASRSYIDRHGVPDSPESLADHVCLHYPRRQSTVTWTFESEVPKGQPPRRCTVPVKGCFAVNNSEGLRDAAEAGLGITLLPDFTAQSALREGSLQRVLPGWNAVGVFGDTLYAIRPYSTHVPRAVQVLVAYLRDAFRPGFAV